MKSCLKWFQDQLNVRDVMREVREVHEALIFVLMDYW